MGSTIERILELRRRRQGRYFDLCCESGACDASGDGRELTHDDLKDLDQVSRELGKSERMLGDDLSAAIRWHTLKSQLAKAEDQKPAAEKNIAKLNNQIKQAVADRSEVSDASSAARRQGKLDAAIAHDRDRTALSGKIGRLQDEIMSARRPLGLRETLPKQIGELVAANPWLGSKA